MPVIVKIYIASHRQFCRSAFRSQYWKTLYPVPFYFLSTGGIL